MANESMAGPGSLGRPNRMIDYGDDESGASKVPTIQEQLAEANRRLVEAQGELESMYDRNSPLGKTIKYIEEGGVPEIITNPEKREVLEKIHEEMARSLLSPVISLAFDARTGFVPQNWPLQHEWSTITRIGDTIRTKASIYQPYRPDKEKDPKTKTQIEQREHVHNVYTSRVMAEMTRFRAFSTIIENGFSPMSLYFDGKGMVGLDTRRLTVMPTDSIRKAFGKIHDRVLTSFEEGQKSLPGSDAPKKIENAPRFFEEGFSDVIKEDAARMLDLANVISEMNKRNPFAEDGREMRIEDKYISKTEQEFIASLFKRVDRKDEYGNTENLGVDEKSTKIRIYFDKNNKQISVGKDGAPTAKEDHYKDVYIHTLAYENTVRSETEHKRFMSLMMSYVMTSAREKLRAIVEKNSDILSVTDEKDPVLQEFKNLIQLVDQGASNLIEDWDTPRVSLEREAAAAAFELNFMLQCATVSVANLGHIYHWRMEETPKGSGRYLYRYLDEIGDPDMGFDAMTAMFTMQHEYTYGAIKNRISTPLLPPVDPKFAEKVINFIVRGGRDPELLAYAEKSQYIARGFGVIGLFAEQLKKNPSWLEGENFRKELELECNDEVIQVLEQTMFGVPTSYNEKVFPLPILPFFRSIGLFDSMHVSKDKTIQDLLNERKLITEVDWEQYHPFANDGRAVVGRFLTDITYIMYGGLDTKSLEALFSNPTEAIRKIIKAMDIGARAEARTFNYTHKVTAPVTGTEKVITEPKQINKKVSEITYASYLSIAYLAFYKFGLWDGHQKFSKDKEQFINAMGVPTETSFVSFLEAASYLLKEKQGFKHYRDSYMLLMIGLAEFTKGIGVQADVLYKDTEQLRAKVSGFLKK
ncbi:MAG: hypothetical protein UU32_C0018G0001 [Candidatus Woesebacteria bacterium GW2011_GWB1_41_10]|uniref:Uncharacterized protein n=1 Tax=Candidatus Woesebacteria bacterium GW2011_GWB1_41_10 TaxID=1618577 RepID=A0A0G0XEX8_9BACT|nr:MAG: hypothetical protein UU32_C0018G0001 [Candidatus Woesebacteria bacterium GW2011_GWB1_41_10]